MEDKNIAKTRRIIASNRYMSLASSFENHPWIASVFFAVDEYYNFYFVSAKDSSHAMHIQYNSEVAIAIFDSQEPPEIVDGVQIAGFARILEGLDLQKAMEVYYHKRFPKVEERANHYRSPDNFLNNSVRRFFRVNPTHIYTVDLNITDVDRRIEVELESLRGRPIW
ncbi:MAG TPA: pyridoxamine 5'-phosphate oxidase family protein [Methylomirabilota bacterium]|nr:pyridoxamine 5'-phosphate oxidase family protein [Methylomirabilota bacterium]